MRSGNKKTMPKRNRVNKRRSSRNSSVIKVYEQFKQIILGFELKPGEKIREEVICNKLKCSRTPVREAIIRLEQEGLLERIPHHGVFVKKFSVREIMESNSVQELLEAPTALLALENRTDEDLNELRFNLENCRRHFAEGNLSAYSMESLRFHQILYDASKNSVLSQILQNLWEKLIIKTKINFLNDERMRINLEDHEEMYQCLVQQDRAKMEKLIRRHTAEGHENFLCMIRERPELLYVSI